MPRVNCNLTASDLLLIGRYMQRQDFLEKRLAALEAAAGQSEDLDFILKKIESNNAIIKKITNP